MPLTASRYYIVYLCQNTDLSTTTQRLICILPGECLAALCLGAPSIGGFSVVPMPPSSVFAFWCPSAISASCSPTYLTLNLRNRVQSSYNVIWSFSLHSFQKSNENSSIYFVNTRYLISTKIWLTTYTTIGVNLVSENELL